MRQSLAAPEHFKDSPLGLIPREWNVVQLGDLAEMVTSGPRDWAEYYSDQGPLFLRISNLTREHLNLRLHDLVHVCLPSGVEGSRTAVQEGDVLISITADLGMIGVIPCGFAQAFVNQHIALVRLDRGTANPRWVGNYLAGQQGRRQFYRLNDAGAKAGLNLPTVAALLTALPTMEEQTQIAAILDAADAAIQQTEALIAKLKQMKAGLLHDLLTRGLDEHGQLRDPVAHPEQFKGSPLGRIPRDWVMRPLSTIAELGSGVTLGRDLGGYGTVELPYLRVANVQDGYLDLTEIKTVRVRKDEVSRFMLQPGDVLMNEGGDYDKLGRGTVWSGQISPCLHQNHVFRVRTDRQQLRPEFLAAVSGSGYGKRFFILCSKQSTNLASINSTQLKSFPVPCPSMSEQNRIVDALGIQDARIRAEEAYRDKLKLLKKGLMDDLLTGRVRVASAMEAMP